MAIGIDYSTNSWGFSLDAAKFISTGDALHYNWRKSERSTLSTAFTSRTMVRFLRIRMLPIWSYSRVMPALPPPSSTV